MKLIIDIDEDDYKEVKEYGINTFPSLAITIKNGTPLDNLRTKIDNIKVYGQIDEHNLFVRSADEIKKMALIVIDRYRNEVNE